MSTETNDLQSYGADAGKIMLTQMKAGLAKFLMEESRQAHTSMNTVVEATVLNHAQQLARNITNAEHLSEAVGILDYTEAEADEISTPATTSDQESVKAALAHLPELEERAARRRRAS